MKSSSSCGYGDELADLQDLIEEVKEPPNYRHRFFIDKVGEEKPRRQYTTNVRLSSKEDDMNAEFWVEKMIRNKYFHNDFDPTMCSKEWIGHFQEIFDEQKVGYNIADDFAENFFKD